MTDPRQTKDQRINLAIAYISKEELKSVWDKWRTEGHAKIEAVKFFMGKPNR
jgi:peptidyl-tRNA hydrolase